MIRLNVLGKIKSRPKQNHFDLWPVGKPEAAVRLAQIKCPLCGTKQTPKFEVSESNSATQARLSSGPSTHRTKRRLGCSEWLSACLAWWAILADDMMQDRIWVCLRKARKPFVFC